MKTIYKITYNGKRYQFDTKKAAELWREGTLKKLQDPKNIIKGRQQEAIQALKSFEIDESKFFVDTSYIHKLIGDMWKAYYLYNNDHVPTKPKLTIREEVVYETAGEAAL